jgi:hypothetical protein
MRNTSLSLWEPFGLRSSPFFQGELEPSQTGDRPISLFIGRNNELSRLTRRLVSDSASRTIVEGEVGVGKTSFVNRLKAEVAQLGIASHDQPIRLSSDMDWKAFIRETLRTILRIRLGMKLDNAEDDFWKRTVALFEGSEIRSGGASAFGFGGSVNRSRIDPALPPDSLFDHLGEALLRMKQRADGGLLLHVNNLENQAAENADQLSVLIRNLRDFFLLDGAHWAFVGASGVEEAIFRRFDQVGGIFPSAEVLDPLDPDEVGRLLQERYEHLKLPKRKVIEPVEAPTVTRLYSLYRGDLRNFLRLLGEAAERLLGVAGVRPMTLGEIISEMGPEYSRRLQNTIGETDIAYLATLVSGTNPEHAFRVTDATRITKLSQGAASDLIRRLLASRCIAVLRTEGRNVYYRPTGQALIGLPHQLTLPAGEHSS